MQVGRQALRCYQENRRFSVNIEKQIYLQVLYAGLHIHEKIIGFLQFTTLNLTKYCRKDRREKSMENNV